MLWDQLNNEKREHHNTCVELFYRLHCLAPSANICEDIICHALLDHDKVRLLGLKVVPYLKAEQQKQGCYNRTGCIYLEVNSTVFHGAYSLVNMWKIVAMAICTTHLINSCDLCLFLT